VQGECTVVKAGKYKSEFTDIDFDKLKQTTRVLADGTTERVLAGENDEKTVVATYQSEKSYTG
jgi:hypothetical protein